MTHIWPVQLERGRAPTSYGAGVVQRHLEVTQSAIPAEALAIERMSPTLDPLSLKFAIHLRSARLEGLDVGCGEGVATIAALARGARVVAVDPDSSALSRLLAHVPSEQYRRLKVREALLQDLDFKFARFSAVHASRVLHLLAPDDLQHTLGKFFRWLYPNGKLFISVFNPLGPFWRDLRVEYSRRMMLGEPWPGYIESLSAAMPELRGATTGVHLLDESVLSRELKTAGFVVEDSSSYLLPWDTEQLCTGVVARCGS